MITERGNGSASNTCAEDQHGLLSSPNPDKLPTSGPGLYASAAQDVKDHLCVNDHPEQSQAINQCLVSSSADLPDNRETQRSQRKHCCVQWLEYYLGWCGSLCHFWTLVQMPYRSYIHLQDIEQNVSAVCVSNCFLSLSALMVYWVSSVYYAPLLLASISHHRCRHARLSELYKNSSVPIQCSCAWHCKRPICVVCNMCHEAAHIPAVVSCCLLRGLHTNPMRDAMLLSISAMSFSSAVSFSLIKRATLPAIRVIRVKSRQAYMYVSKNC